MHIGNRLKRLRNLRGLSQSKICKGIVSPSHYSNIESGRYEASDDILESIARRIQVPTSYLIEIHEDSQEISELLIQYERLLELDISKANSFLEENRDRLEFIPSLHQETEYLLLLCFHKLKLTELEEAKQLHNDITYYIQKDNIAGLDKKTKYKFLYISGLLCFRQRQFTESYDLFNKALPYSLSELDKGKVLFNLALICYQISDTDKGLIYTQEAKSIFMDSHKWKETVETYILLGILSIEKSDYQTANDVLGKALDLSSEKKYEDLLPRIYHNLGLISYNQESYAASLDYYKKSLQKKLECNQKNTFVTYLAILNVFLKQQDIQQTTATLAEAQRITQNEHEINNLKIIEAKIKYQLSDFDAYVQLMEEAIEYFYSNQQWDDLRGNSKELSDHHYENRRYKKAYYYLKIEHEAHLKLY